MITFLYEGKIVNLRVVSRCIHANDVSELYENWIHMHAQRLNVTFSSKTRRKCQIFKIECLVPA